MNVSVVVVTHNCREHVRRCLDELRATGDLADADEILVVDNASTDGTPELVEAAYPEVRLLGLGDNLGFGAANNRGAAAAEGEALLLLNSDAWLEPGALPRLRQALADDPRLALVAPRLFYPDGRPQFVWSPEVSIVGEAVQLLRNRIEGSEWSHGGLVGLLRPFLGPGWLTAACVLARRSAFEAVGGFDEDFFLYFEDVDLCRRLQAAGWRADVVSDARARHVRGGSWNEAAKKRYRRSQALYYRKHRPAWERWLIERRGKA